MFIHTSGCKYTSVFSRFWFCFQVEFLNILPTRGPEAFSCFVNALNETEQTHLANCLANTKLANHCTNVDKNFSVCNEESTFPLSSFHFSQNTSCKKNTSKRCVETCHNQSSCDTMQMPIRFPSEHDEQVSSQITVGQSPPPSKRQCCVSSSVDETMEVIPSPCNALSDLESTATMESLEMDAQLSAKPTCPQKDAISARPHLQAGNTATENQRYSLNNAQPMKNLLSIDLADGPHRDDLIVQHANMQVTIKCVTYTECSCMYAGNCCVVLNLEKTKMYRKVKNSV